MAVDIWTLSIAIPSPVTEGSDVKTNRKRTEAWLLRADKGCEARTQPLDEPSQTGPLEDETEAEVYQLVPLPTVPNTCHVKPLLVEYWTFMPS